MVKHEDKIYALDLGRDEWTKLLYDIDQPKFRVDQLVQWLWRKHVYNVDEMTNLSKPLRDELRELLDFQLPTLMKEQRSTDGTRKYLWQFRDGQSVESVLMKHNDRLTACVSTQVGCPLQCAFCATGLSGYVRNLSAGEIAAQFLGMERVTGRDITNIVYMGMGEPFLNTVNVLKSVRMLNDNNMRNLGIRHFTISTSGVLPGIISLANSGLGVRLAVSLHAVDDELRGQLMPIDQKYSVAELREAMAEYQKITGDRITIEYALFGGVNDTVEHARALVRYLKGLHVFINLIPFNAVDNRFTKPAAETVLRFRKVLDTAGFETEIRQEYGADIDAACGQLRRKTMSGEAVRLDSKPGFKPGVATTEQRKTPMRSKMEKSEKTAHADGHPTVKRGSDGNKPGRGTSSGGYTGSYAEERSGHKPRRNDNTRDYEKKPDNRSGNRAEEKNYDKFTPRGSKPAERPSGTTKRRRTGEPKKERYRSGKMKEERPSYKGQHKEKAPEGATKWFEGAVKPRRPKSKKPSTPGNAGISMTGVKKRSKAAVKSRAKKK